MPRSKKSKLVSLTKTEKKSTRAHKEQFAAEIQAHASKWKYAYVIHVGNMRNSSLKVVREQWKGTGRLFFGRTRVMVAALGTSEDTECRTGIHAVSKHLKGPVGLFFTDSPPDEVKGWFDSFSKPDFARAGNPATEEIILPIGPLFQYNDPSSPFPSSMDPQLRKLGLTTVLNRGVPSLATEHVVCKKNEKLTKEQAQLLKLIGVQMAVFKVLLSGRWSEEEGWVPIDTIPEGDENDHGNEVESRIDDADGAMED